VNRELELCGSPPVPADLVPDIGRKRAIADWCRDNNVEKPSERAVAHHLLDELRRAGGSGPQPPGSPVYRRCATRHGAHSLVGEVRLEDDQVAGSECVELMGVAASCSRASEDADEGLVCEHGVVAVAYGVVSSSCCRTPIRSS
jgi:hypothetical protein